MSNPQDTGLGAFNAADAAELTGRLAAIFASEPLARAVVAGRPYADADAAAAAVHDRLRALDQDAVLDSVNAHPPIGAATRRGSLSEAEQAAAKADPAAATALARIAELNEVYHARFGHTFLIRAAGLGAGEILARLEERLGNEPGVEWAETVDNLAAIDELRLRGLLDELAAGEPGPGGPSLSTHVLDTATGRPAAGVAVELRLLPDDADGAGGGSGIGELIAAGVTDDDGRHRLSEGLAAGVHRLRFDLDGYFAAAGVRGLYPWADVVFRVDADSPGHLHIPLLLAPYGYSTYRGS